MTVLADTAPAAPAAPTRLDGLDWLEGLGARGGDPAIVLADRTLTHRELGGLVDAMAGRLDGPRRLVLVEGANRLDAVVAYLGALRAGHAVLLVPAGSEAVIATLRAAYEPDIVLGADGGVEVVRAESAHDLHPELALLLSTSGSTGSPKLVRLSWDNLRANAEQIADYLDIRETDCAATTLPLHYCYGLSVLHSHLSRGASVALTDLSVVDACFWSLFERAGATTLAGVPYTFELLDRVGFAEMDLPRLRYVTQAGGRMDPERVRHWAGVGRERGWDLFVMYGQTEATARMAYLPPALALDHPSAIGVPVAGGAFDIVDGELVYTGPNVMLGYAHSPADLALGRTIHRLHTGDLARRTDDGLYEVTGRRSRHVKVLGHRIDLDRVEEVLRRSRDVRVAGADGRVVVSVRVEDGRWDAGDAGAVRRAAAQAAGTPASAVHVVAVDEHPRLASGKPDHAAILALPDSLAGPEGAPGGTVTQLYAAVLGRADVVPSSTFVGLGGDSLSYVEVSLRLEALLGELPPSWHVLSVGELESRATPHREEPDSQGPTERRWRLRTVESSVWLRALAIVFIVGTHADAYVLQGTAHALLMLAGFNMARFQLADASRRARVRGLLGAVGRVVAPTIVVVATAHLAWGQYTSANVALLNWVFGEAELGPPWRFWFIEALVLALVLTTAIVAIPAVDRIERRWPFALPMGLVAVAALTRFELFELPVPRMQGSALVVLFLFFLGWAAGRAGSRRERWIVTAAALATVSTFSGNPVRDLLTLAVILTVLWVPTGRVPQLLVPAVQVLAASSLYIYVFHWQVLPLLWGRPWLALAGSLGSGIAYWWLWTTALPALTGWVRAGVGRAATDRSASASGGGRAAYGR